MDQEKSRGPREPRAERKNQESQWPKWRDYIGKKSWGQGSEAAGLDKLSLGGGLRGAERSLRY